MSNEILVALLGLSGSAIGSLVGIFANSRLTSYRLQELEKKVSKHNNLVERMYKAEEKNELQNQIIKTINRRIKDLEDEKRENH